MKNLWSLMLGFVLLSTAAVAQNVQSAAATDTSVPAVRVEKGVSQEKNISETDKKPMKKHFKGRKSELAKKLNLTEEQRAKAKEIHEKSKAEMEALHAEMKVLREKADALREKNKKEFESILTDEQKKTLAEIQQKMEKKKKERAEHRKKLNAERNYPVSDPIKEK